MTGVWFLGESGKVKPGPVACYTGWHERSHPMHAHVVVLFGGAEGDAFLLDVWKDNIPALLRLLNRYSHAAVLP